MKTIEFSYTPSDAVDPDALQHFFQDFEKRTNITVRLDALDTKDARDTLNRFAVEHKGADVSQIGSTWSRGLVDMNVLRPFSSREIHDLGGKESFLHVAWENALLPDKFELSPAELDIMIEKELGMLALRINRTLENLQGGDQ